MTMSDTKDRVAGVMMGMAAGDRIGGPIRMALRVGESLLERRAFDPADLMGRYLHWWRSGAFDTGPTVASVLTLVDRGVPYTEAAVDVHEEAGGMTAGCNPAHRSAAPWSTAYPGRSRCEPQLRVDPRRFGACSNPQRKPRPRDPGSLRMRCALPSTS
jgi:hypothetical protein